MGAGWTSGVIMVRGKMSSTRPWRGRRVHPSSEQSRVESQILRDDSPHVAVVRLRAIISTDSDGRANPNTRGHSNVEAGRDSYARADFQSVTITDSPASEIEGRAARAIHRRLDSAERCISRRPALRIQGRMRDLEGNKHGGR
jgi:hypothetical protein